MVLCPSCRVACRDGQTTKRQHVHILHFSNFPALGCIFQFSNPLSRWIYALYSYYMHTHLYRCVCVCAYNTSTCKTETQFPTQRCPLQLARVPAAGMLAQVIGVRATRTVAQFSMYVFLLCGHFGVREGRAVGASAVSVLGHFGMRQGQSVGASTVVAQKKKHALIRIMNQVWYMIYDRRYGLWTIICHRSYIMYISWGNCN